MFIFAWDDELEDIHGRDVAGMIIISLLHCVVNLGFVESISNQFSTFVSFVTNRTFFSMSSNLPRICTDSQQETQLRREPSVETHSSSSSTTSASQVQKEKPLSHLVKAWEHSLSWETS